MRIGKYNRYENNEQQYLCVQENNNQKNIINEKFHQEIINKEK